MIDNTPNSSVWYRRMIAPFSYDVGVLLLRLFFGAALALTHGQGKVFGNTDKFITGVEGMHLPFPIFFGWAAALSEFVGGVLLAIGLGTRIVSLLIAITMIVAGFIAHSTDPFAVKELAFSYLTAMLAIFLLGPGRISVDNALFGRRRG